MSQTVANAPSPAPNHLPPGVRASVERANARLREIGAMPAEGAPQEGQEGQPAPQEGQQSPQEGQQQPQEGQPAQPAPQEGQPQQPAQDAPKGDEWEHKYKSLKGRYDSEMGKLQGQMEGLRELLANLQTAQPPREEKKPTKEETFSAPADTVLTDDERRDYGDDMLAVIRKVATQVAYDVARQVRDEVEKVRETVGTVTTSVQKTEQEKFFETLGTAVSDWQALNRDEGFLRWLGEIDPLAGRQRQELLNEAVGARNAARAAAFFNSYKREQAAVTPQAGQPHQPGREAPRGATPATGKVTLDSLAAPGRGTLGGGTSPQEKPVYSSADIARFYSDRARGRFRGTPAEAARMEADIIDATKEGRIHN